MDLGILLGALALGTIGMFLLASIWHVATFLGSGENRRHAHNVFVGNGKAAATVTAEQAHPGSQLSKPLSVRLNESIDSQHEVDPSSAQTQVQRATQYHRERIAI